jgi:hypothetical protein
LSSGKERALSGWLFACLQDAGATRGGIGPWENVGAPTFKVLLEGCSNVVVIYDDGI